MDFHVQDGQFWLNGRPQLIQAGEFHYFRCARENWRHRLGLLQAAGFNAVASYIPWLWHQLEEDTSDLDGHSHPSRDLAGFLDLAADMGFLIIARPGPYIMAETINEGIPPWVLAKYPQVAWISQEGQAHNIVSYLHPDFQRCVRKWYRAVFEVLAPRQITRGGRIVMVQLDNEMGMMPWVRNIIDTNPDTMGRLADYLRDTYGDHLAERYPTDALAEFLREGILHPTEPHAARIVDDYRHFYRGYLREYASWLWAEARANGLEVPPVANIHGFGNGGKTFPIGLSQLVDVLRLDGMISATDVYPLLIGEGNFHQLLLVNEMTRALQYKEQPLFSIEFQAGGNQDFSGAQSSMPDLHSRLCLSVGMRAINHYLFCNGENDPILSPVKRHDWGHPIRKDGTLRQHYFRYPRLSRVLAAYGDDLTLSQPQTATTIGFLLDYYMTEVNNAYSQPAADVITHQRDVVLFDFIARGLALTHRPFDAVDLDRGELDVARTPLCWVMMDKQCHAATQQKLVDYVRAGGKLVLAGRMCVEDFGGRPCTILKDALGIESIESDPPFAPTSISALGYQDVPASFVETYAGDFDEIVAIRGQDEVVGFAQNVGRGQVLLFGAAMTANTLEDIDVVERMARKMGCPRLFQVDDWADVRLSHNENGSFLFVANYLDDPVATTIRYKDEPLFGGNPVSLPARRGLILPMEWRPREGVTIHYLTSEVVEIVEDGSTITFNTAQDRFDAELSLAGYRCTQPASDRVPSGCEHVVLHAIDGVIEITRAP